MEIVSPTTEALYADAATLYAYARLLRAEGYESLARATYRAAERAFARALDAALGAD